jgi:hypothetical protein
MVTPVGSNYYILASSNWSDNNNNSPQIWLSGTASSTNYGTSFTSIISLTSDILPNTNSNPSLTTNAVITSITVSLILNQLYIVFSTSINGIFLIIYNPIYVPPIQNGVTQIFSLTNGYIPCISLSNNYYTPSTYNNPSEGFFLTSCTNTDNSIIVSNISNNVNNNDFNNYNSVSTIATSLTSSNLYNWSAITTDNYGNIYACNNITNSDTGGIYYTYNYNNLSILPTSSSSGQCTNQGGNFTGNTNFTDIDMYT